MKQAIYAASLDPITYGHVNVVERALKVFDHILVAIGVNETKKSLFSLEERVMMAEKELHCFGKRVEVVSFQGMLSDFSYENNITTIIRGARNSPDFDYEKLLSDINRYGGVDTIIYTTTPRLSHVSSSAAKAITLNAGKNIIDYVSVGVKRRLEEELLYQYRFGITGEIGAGKSYVAELFHNHIKWATPPMIFHNSYCDPHIIDMDCIGHYILEKGTEPIYQKVRAEVCKCLGVPKKGKFVNVKELGKIIFNDQHLKNCFNDMMLEPMQYELRKTLLKLKGTAEKKSIVFITGALLVEMNGLSEFNNNLILVNAPDKIIKERLKKTRGYSDEEIKRRQEAQETFDIKGFMADREISENGYGHVWTIENDGRNFQDQFDEILNDVLGEHE